ncbi:MAG TPA: SDR family oxidoreductase [Micromonospora sp.]
MSSGAALVTGAGSGIGRAVAEGLAGTGRHVVCVGRRPERITETVELITAAGGSAEALVLDVTDEAAVDAAIADVARRHGRLDVLVNNAGVFYKGVVADLDRHAWEQTLQVNLTGVFFCTRAAVRVMRAQPVVDGARGYLVSINSGAGVRGYATGSAYAAAKHGLRGFVESLRAEVAADRIKVSDVVVAATVASEMNAHRDVPKLPATTVADAVLACVAMRGDAVLERVDLGQLRD